LALCGALKSQALHWRPVHWDRLYSYQDPRFIFFPKQKLEPSPGTTLSSGPLSHYRPCPQSSTAPFILFCSSHPGQPPRPPSPHTVRFLRRNPLHQSRRQPSSSPCRYPTMLQKHPRPRHDQLQHSPHALIPLVQLPNLTASLLSELARTLTRAPSPDHCAFRPCRSLTVPEIRLYTHRHVSVPLPERTSLEFIFRLLTSSSRLTAASFFLTMLAFNPLT